MEQEIRIREFQESDLESVYKLVHDTIAVSYREIYPHEAIDMYKMYHSKENILRDAVTGFCAVAESGGEMVGTATLVDTDVRRVYISPSYQHAGIGGKLFSAIEEKARELRTGNLELGASLISKEFWESQGFTVISEDTITIQNNKELRFYRMTKKLSSGE